MPSDKDILTFSTIDVIQEVDGVFDYTVTDVTVISAQVEVLSKN